MSWTALAPAAPEIALLALICGVLVADLFVEDGRRGVTYWLSMAALAITAVVLLATAPESRTLLFSGSYVSDGLSQVMKLASVALVALSFVYARGYLAQNGLHKGEFYTLGMFGL